jgi:hypothetical protein
MKKPNRLNGRLKLSLVTTTIASLALLAQPATAQQWTTNNLLFFGARANKPSEQTRTVSKGTGGNIRDEKAPSESVFVSGCGCFQCGGSSVFF